MKDDFIEKIKEEMNEESRANYAKIEKFLINRGIVNLKPDYDGGVRVVKLQDSLNKEIVSVYIGDVCLYSGHYCNLNSTYLNLDFYFEDITDFIYKVIVCIGLKSS